MSLYERGKCDGCGKHRVIVQTIKTSTGRWTSSYEELCKDCAR